MPPYNITKPTLKGYTNMALQECGLNTNNAQKELRPHGTEAFPCAGYESERTASPDDVIPWHWHEEFEMILVREGTLRLKVLSETYTLKQGELAIMNSGALHYGDTANYCHLESMVFSPLLITGNADSDLAKKYITPLTECSHFSCLILPAADPLIADYQSAFQALKTGAFAFEFTVRDVLSRIIVEIYRKYEKSIVTPEKGKNLDSTRLTQMLDFIEAHYPENITLADLCGAAYIGKREAMRCFKRTVGESPMQYLTKFRLMKSAGMLLRTQSLSIAEIAGSCGFDSPSYYTKKFKTLYNCTPRDYVKQRQQVSSDAPSSLSTR